MAVRGRLIRYPAAGLSPIRPKRESDKPGLLKLADRIVCTQYGDYIPVSPRILTLVLVAEELNEFGNGAAVLWTVRIRIMISGNDD